MLKDIDDRELPLLDHLIELRNRLIYSVAALFVGFLVCYFFAQQIYVFLTQPLADICLDTAEGEASACTRMIYTALTEVFFTYLKIAFFAGAFITFPFIAYASTWLGRELLGTHGRLSAKKILNESADASMQVWHNFTAMFGHGTPHWDRLGSFYHDIYQPYMVGGLILGIIAAVVAHYLTVPVIRAYHRRRARKLAKRIERIRSVGTPPAKPQAGPRPDDPPP